MALVRVSRAKRWKCSRPVLEAFLQDACERLASSRVELARTMAAAVDSRLPWWSMETLNLEDFCALQAAARAVYQAWAERGPPSQASLDAYSGRLARLNEFLHLLAADERATASGSQGG